MTDSASTLFASVDGLAATLGNQECVFQARQTGAAHIMTNDVLQAMSLCRQFQPLAAHVAVIEQQLPALQGQQQAILRVLEFLRQRDLLQSADMIVERVREQALRPAAEAPVVAAIRTCDRPAELARLLASIDQYQRQFGRRLRYLIIDDSRQAAHQSSNHRSVTEAGLDAHYLGRDWRSDLAQRSQSSGVEPGLLQTLLGGAEHSPGFSGGQVWNALLLATTGHKLLLLDDDFVLEFRRRPTASQALSLTDEPKQLSFAPDPNTLAAQTELVSVDPLAAPIALAGAPLGRVFEQGIELSPASLQGLSWSQVDELLNQTTINSVESGSWGDMRMDTSLWLYMLPAAQTTDWWRSRGTYFDQLRSPTIVHAVEQPQLGDCASFTPLAVDNQQLLPPAAPLGRGEDLFFNLAQRCLYPRGVNLQLPWMVGHLRPTDQPRDEDPGAYSPWLSRLIGEYALDRSQQHRARAPDARMRQLVGDLRDLAEADPATRQTVLAEFLCQLRADVVTGIQQTLASAPEAPAFFQADARDWIEHNGRALTRNDSLRMRDWPQSLTPDQCAERLQRDLLDYAGALSAWPTLWQWACEQDQLLPAG